MCLDWGLNPQPRYMPWSVKPTIFWCTGWWATRPGSDFLQLHFSCMQSPECKAADLKIGPVTEHWEATVFCWYTLHNCDTLNSFLSPGQVALLFGASSHTPKIASLISDQGTYLGCGFDLWLGHVREANRSMFLSHINVSLLSSYILG